MTELKRLEEILYRLHQERLRCETEYMMTADQLESVLSRIRRFEADLEERRLELGIVRG